MKYTFTLENDEKKNPGRILPETVYVHINGGNKSVFQSSKKYDRIKISLELKIEPKYFGKKEENFKYNPTIIKKYATSKTQLLNIQIRKYENIIEETYASNTAQHFIPTKDEFKKMLRTKIRGNDTDDDNDNNEDKLNRNIYLIDYIEYKISYFESRLYKGDKDNISSSRIKIYNSLLRHLKNYETYIKKRLKFSTLNPELVVRFYDFINDYKAKQIEVSNDNFKINRNTKNIDGMSQNTLAKYSKALIALVNKATNEDNVFCSLNTKNKSIKIKEVNSSKSEFYLEEGFLIKLLEIIPDEPKLLLARNYLLIGCLLGFRFEHFIDLQGKDYMTYKDEDISFKYIISYSAKTESKAYIPLFKLVTEILDKFYEGKFPNIPSNATINQAIKNLIKNYGLNEKIKIHPIIYGKGKIDKKTTFDEIVSTHDCRSSLISNLSTYGVDETILAAITHPKKKNNKLGAFNSYNKIDYLKKAKRFYWEITHSVKESEIYKF